MNRNFALALVAILAFTIQSASANNILLDPMTNDGSFENAPGADNVGSANWLDIGSQSFWSINRSLGPNGNPDPHEGAFSGVANPGGRAAIESAPINVDLSSGSVFALTGYFATNQTGGATSDYSIGLRFNDVANTLVDLGVTSNLGADASAFTVSGANSNITGLRRISLTTEPNPNRWLEFGHEITYTGGPATQVSVVFEARTGGGQTYWDNFSLTQVPEPNSAVLIGILSAAVTIRRKRV